ERMGLPPAAPAPAYGAEGPRPGPAGHGLAPGHGPGPGHGPAPGHGPGPGRVPGPVPGPGGSLPAPAAPPPAPYREPGYDRYDEPTYGGFEPREPARPGMLGSEDDRFAADMTSEMRLGDPGGPPPLPPSPRAPEPPRPSFAGPPPPAGPGGPPPGLGPRGASGPPPMGSPAGPGYGPGMGGSDEPVSGELARLDQLRRSFQPRRFGSGYD